MKGAPVEEAGPPPADPAGDEGAPGDGGVEERDALDVGPKAPVVLAEADRTGVDVAPLPPAPPAVTRVHHAFVPRGQTRLVTVPESPGGGRHKGRVPAPVAKSHGTVRWHHWKRGGTGEPAARSHDLSAYLSPAKLLALPPP